MSGSALSLVVEGIVSILLVVMIVYASRLNRRLADLRGQESELQDGIARFNEAAARAEAAAARLKSVGAEAERTVRAALERAQAVRDELMFLSDRGDTAVREMARSAKSPAPVTKEGARRGSGARHAADAAGAGKRPRPEPHAGIADLPQPETGALRSSAERELLKAIRAAHGAR